jgi:ligand-binding sensor domain-containing protein
MKFARIVATAATLLCLTLLASVSFAATNALPLNDPSGRALDAKGNLYVTNKFADNVLVYNPNYVQLTAKSIKQGISHPSGLAFDASGNLWVSNIGNWAQNIPSTVTMYTKGIQNTSATITASFASAFFAVAIDGIGNLYANQDTEFIDIYAPPSAFELPSLLTQSLLVPGRILALAVSRGTIVYGDPNNQQLNLYTATQVLTTGAFDGFTLPNYTGVAIAADANGNFYVGNSNGTVNIVGPGGQTPFATLSEYPNAIAVDNVRGRVYIATLTDSIYVYSTTTGELLHKIQ